MLNTLKKITPYVYEDYGCFCCDSLELNNKELREPSSCHHLCIEGLSLTYPVTGESITFKCKIYTNEKGINTLETIINKKNHEMKAVRFPMCLKHEPIVIDCNNDLYCDSGNGRHPGPGGDKPFKSCKYKTYLIDTWPFCSLFHHRLNDEKFVSKDGFVHQLYAIRSDDCINAEV